MSEKQREASPEPTEVTMPPEIAQPEDNADGKEDEGTSGSGGSSSSASPEPQSSSQAEQNEQDQQPPPNAWQAIYSPQHGAYYFYNSITQETTWTNPLEPKASTSAASASASASSSSSSSASPQTGAPGNEGDSSSLAGAGPSDPNASETAATPAAAGPSSHYAALQAAALAQGIDPALAHLDPTLLSSVPGQAADASGIPLFTAKFNRHTGAFAKPDARDPSHLSEYERSKRMSEFYFDVNKWEEELAQQGGSIQGEEAGKKRKRPTKKDLDRFKEQKKLKKLAKTAWLRT